MIAALRPAGGWRHWFIQWPRYWKRVALVSNDLALLTFALWLSYSFRLNTFYVPADWSVAGWLALAPVLGVVTYYYFGLYKLVTRFIGPSGAQRVMFASALSVTLWTCLLWYVRYANPAFTPHLLVPRSAVLLFVFSGAGLVWGSRQFVAWVLNASPQLGGPSDAPRPRRVLIYGAGPTGVQLLNALQLSSGYKAIGFIDERSTLKRQVVAGLKVHRPTRLRDLIRDHLIDEIFLAMPEASRARRRTILKRLEVYKVGVRTLPGLADIASGRVGISDLKAVSASDLLGRDRVRPDAALLRRAIFGKSVLVTGAGGSIGSELARQIYEQKPKRLILLDNAEPALFEIEQELLSAARRLKLDPAASGITAVLGSIGDEGLIRRVLKEAGIETVFHAAAYKHVPMVEHNPVAGLRNNTFGTKVLAEAARDQGVERFVLISTDKAVRPTNIMGASKRLAELQLQAMAAEDKGKTIFTMVRFGNVLDSSGSVVRLFRKQIENGGPVTVTHPDIIRYFMSIPEAAELVIQAGALAHGGEVFVLDMGAAVKIDALARSMIKHVGLKVKDEANPHGDIAIVYTGLRPGEKLYEELLIGEHTGPTAHPRIKRTLEPGLSANELEHEFAALQRAMATNDIDAMHAVLTRTVEGYVPERRHLAAPAAPSSDAARVLH